jgi:hypothetical protein
MKPKKALLKVRGKGRETTIQILEYIAPQIL